MMTADILNKWIYLHLMLLGTMLMMNALPCLAFNNIIMDPMRAVVTHRAVQKFLEFKHNVENMWLRKTTTKSTAEPRYGIYRLPSLRKPSAKFYRPEPLKRNLTITQVYPKRLMLIATSKKRLLNDQKILNAKNKENTQYRLRYPYGRRYTFIPMNSNNFGNDANSKWYLYINRFPINNNHLSNVPGVEKYNQLPRRKGYHARIISTAEIDPMLRINDSIILEIPNVKKRRKKRGNNLIKVKIPEVQNILSCKSSYPRCLSQKKFWPLLGRYEPSSKKKVEKRSHDVSCLNDCQSKTKKEVWPLLGHYNQVPLSHQAQLDNGLADQLSPALASKRSNQMQLINKLSEMKAKEHIAEDNRLAEMHKTQEAKRDFQERIAEQLDLLSEAKRADLRAKKAFEKVVKLERSLSEQDREIHRLKEFEDQLYEELLESEAEVAMADMQIIPKFINEEDLQEFMTGPKFV